MGSRAHPGALSWRRRVAVVGVLGGLVTLWAGVRAAEVRYYLLHARVGLAGLNGQLTGDRGPAALRRSTGLVMHDLERARAATRDPLWRLLGAVPVAGRSFSLTSSLTGIAVTLVRESVPPALRAEAALRAGRLVSAGRIDLALLARVDGPLRAASDAAERQRALAHRLGVGFVPAPLVRERDQFLRQLDRVAHGLTAAHQALALAPGLLGRDAPRRYLVVVQNNAESRATGGLIGGYAVIRVEAGRILPERFGTNVDLQPASRPVVDLGPEFAADYDRYGTRLAWTSAVSTPDWPSASRIMIGLWRAQGGARLDGVIGLDALSLGDLLAATGPVTYAGRTLGGGNVADFIMRDEYTQFQNNPTDNAARKHLLAELARLMFHRVVSGGARPTALLRALSVAGGDGHLQLFSAHDVEQRVIQGFAVSGALPRAPGAFLEVVTQNGSGNKVDVYIRRRLTYRRLGRGLAGIDLTLSNTVHPDAVPPLVLTRLDPPRGPRVPGETVLVLTLYASVGAEVREVYLDGAPVAVSRGVDSGHGFASLPVLVAPRRPVHLHFLVTDPGGPLTYRQQPLAVPDTLHLHVPVAA